MDTYEKKYKESMAKMSAFLAKHDGFTISKDGEMYKELSEIFDELKESEDEQHRKWILEYLYDGLRKSDEQFKDHFKCAISWFEKQGEHANFINKIQIGDKVTRNEDGVLVNLSQLNRVAKKYEKQCEQKPADKVEPKFHEGDWVVYCNDDIDLITGIEEKGYCINNGGYIPFVCESDMRLWTIEDAKDGDVLCTYECDKPKIVFILKGTPKKHYALSYHCYCNIMYHHFASDSEKGCLAPNDEDVKPTTKEQRDLLFQKMKEAGYEWDAENKQLKKIEPKTAAWTPMDEQRVENLLAIIEGHGYPEEVIWLNSLKDRVRPKQEWSEEDRKIIIELIGIFESAVDGGHVDIPYRLLKDYIMVLKSCLPQNTWKPSEEQITWLYRATDEVRKDSQMKQVLNGLLCDLKKLREE